MFEIVIKAEGAKQLWEVLSDLQDAGLMDMAVVREVKDESAPVTNTANAHGVRFTVRGSRLPTTGGCDGDNITDTSSTHVYLNGDDMDAFQE